MTTLESFVNDLSAQPEGNSDFKLAYKVGDLIRAAKIGEVNWIAHQTNCFHTMASGIAPQIKRAFPSAWKADLETELGSEEKLGTVSYGYEPVYKLTIANIYGQYGFGRTGTDTNYPALQKGLELFTQDILDSRATKVSIGLPKIGCGLGGGDWSLVEKMIRHTICKFFNVTVYVLKEEDIPEWIVD